MQTIHKHTHSYRDSDIYNIYSKSKDASFSFPVLCKMRMFHSKAYSQVKALILLISNIRKATHNSHCLMRFPFWLNIHFSFSVLWHFFSFCSLATTKKIMAHVLHVAILTMQKPFQANFSTNIQCHSRRTLTMIHNHKNQIHKMNGKKEERKKMVLHSKICKVP